MNDRLLLENRLQDHQSSLGWLVRGLDQQNLVWLDFTARNEVLSRVDLTDTAAFDRWLFGEVLRGKVGIGGFMEDRVVYRRSAHYAGEAPRSLHLGLDLWVAADTPVYAPRAGTVHSFRDNRGFGNYGPTVILEHMLGGHTFYTLYGHLSRASLVPLRVRQRIGQDERVGEVGPFPENGDWPPHLHFQVMTDLRGWTGDFPGVVAPSEQKEYAEVCVDPRWLLRVRCDNQ